MTSDDSCTPCKMGLLGCVLCYISKIQILAREALRTGRKSGKSLQEEKCSCFSQPAFKHHLQHRAISPHPGNHFLHLQITIIFHLAALCHACGCSLTSPASTTPKPAEHPLEFVFITSMASSAFFAQAALVQRMEPFVPVPSGAHVSLLSIVWHHQRPMNLPGHSAESHEGFAKKWRQSGECGTDLHLAHHI